MLGKLLKKPQHGLDLPPYKTKTFLVWTQEVASMFMLVLGRDVEKTIYGPMLALLDCYIFRSAPPSNMLT